MQILQKLNENGDVSFGSFIDGKLIDSNDYSDAIISCEAASKLWNSNMSRSSILKKVSLGLKSKIPSFVEVTSLYSYKCTESIIADLEYAVSAFDYFSKLSKKNRESNQNFIGRGVIGAAIMEECTPFSMLGWLTAAPLAAGNVILLLVQPTYSIIALYFVSVLHEFGIPNGVVNILPFMEPETFSKTTFNVRRMIGILPACIQSSAQYHFSNLLVKKPISSPILVLKSADIDSVIDAVINLTRNVEVIWFPNAIYVEESIYDKFLTSLKFNSIKYNASHEKFNENGVNCPRILNDFINEKKGQGFEVIELIHRFSVCFIVVNDDDVANKSVILDENKTIHHLVTLLPIRTLAEGVNRLNSVSGLAASVWSNDAVDIIRVPPQLQYGTVWINCASTYCPSVPFSLWHTAGYGTFSGKRAFYENVRELDNVQKEDAGDSYYATDRNLIFSKKDISSVINLSLNAQSSWYKLDRENRLTFMENVAKLMNQNWDSHYKIVLNNTSETVWQNAIKYLNFWSSYALENVYEQIIYAKQCLVICKSEPLGIIAIVAGSTPLQILLFVIAAALVYGNSVIVGICSEEKSSITATELKNIFSENPQLVTVIVNSTNSLWQQFSASDKIASIWSIKNRCQPPTANSSFKCIVEFEESKNMTHLADRFEIYATKAKTVWLPGA